MTLLAGDTLDRLKRGENTNSILLSIQPTAVQDLIDGCALARTFDRSLVEDVLMPLVPGAAEAATFEQLVAYPFVDRDVRLDDAYLIRPDVASARIRRRIFDVGPTGEALRVLGRALLDHAVRTERPGADLDALYLRVALAPQEVPAIFLELCDDADQRFDLVRYHELIELLDAREFLLSPELRTLVDRERARRAARFEFADERYRTMSYFDRPSMPAQVRDLLREGGPWLHEIEAVGGTGKTMFLRWLIARKCVPERIPCACVDFDRVEREEGSREPWRLLYRIAAQLNAQIAGEPFREILAEYGDLARRDVGANAGVNGDSVRVDIVTRMGSFLRSLPKTARVLVIFDTLEEALLHQGVDVLRLLDDVVALHAQCNGLRVVLSGRYRLADKLSDALRRRFDEQFGDLAGRIRIEPFSPEEGATYLRDTRRTKARDDVIAAAVEKSGGLPFKLALLAELIHGNPVITPEVIRAYPVDLIYLIERVVEHLPDPTLRWTLRYGVIPRALDSEFLADVMRPHLVREMAANPATGRLDDGEAGIEKIATRGPAFPIEAPGWAERTLDVDGVWQGLVQYASTASWVSQVIAANGRTALAFHNDVRNPMRDLLRAHPIYRALHEDAVAYFERKAEVDRERWAVWTRHAVYHRFQLEGESAGDYWRASMAHPAARRPEARREIAAEVLGSEYASDMRPLARRDGGQMIDVPTLVQAHWEFAWALVEIAAGNLGDATAAWRAAGDAAAVAADAQPAGAGSSRVALLVRAAMKRTAGDFSGALDLLDEASAVGGADYPVERERATTLGAAGHPGAADGYARALEWGERSGAPASERLRLLLALASVRASEGDLDRAEAHVREALSLGAPPVENAVAALALARLLVDGGRPRAALEAAPQFGALDPRAADGEALRAEALLALRRPLEALGAVDAALGTLPEGRAGFAPRAMLLELRSRALVDLLEENRALSLTNEARMLWIDVGDVNGATRARQRCIEVLLRDLWDLREARRLVNESATATVEVEVAVAARSALLRAECLARHGDGAAASAQYRELTGPTIHRPPDPFVRIGAMLSQLATGLGTPDTWSDLGAALVRLPSDTSRLLALSVARRLPNLPDVPWEFREKVIRPLFERRDAFVREASATFALVEVAGAFSFGGAASLLPELDRLVDSLPLLLDLQRIGARFSVEPLGSLERFDALSPTYHDHPALGRAVLIQHAEGLIRNGTTTEQLGPVVDRALALSGDSADSRWTARLHTVAAHLDRLSGRVQEMQERLSVVASIADRLGVAASEFGIEPPEEVLESARSAVVATSISVRVGEKLLSGSDGYGVRGYGVRVDLDGRGEPSSTYRAVRVDVRPGEMVTPGVVGHLESDWLSFGESLTETLGLGAPSMWSDELATAPPVDLRFAIDTPELRGLPWELARLPGGPLLSMHAGIRHVYRVSPAVVATRPPGIEEVRWMQEALRSLRWPDLRTDGVLSAATSQALAEFARSEEGGAQSAPDAAVLLRLARALRRSQGRRPLVLLLRPSRQRYGSFGRDYVKGIDPIEFYQDHGFATVVAEDPSAASLRRAITSRAFADGRSPDVVHVSAGFKLRRIHGIPGVTLDFASEWRGATRSAEDVTSDLSPSDLGAAIERLAMGGPAPLVLLDTPRAESRGYAETLRQLVCRNCFAAELHAFRPVNAVVATMLDGRGLEHLVALLGAGELPGNAARALRRVAVGPARDLERALGTLATALFTQDPDAPALLGGDPDMLFERSTLDGPRKA